MSKKKGSICDYKEERDAFLFKTYKRLIREVDSIHMFCRTRNGNHSTLIPTRLPEEIAKTPAPRYWISENRASFVVSAMEKGIEMPNIIPCRKRLYEHLYKLYKEEKNKHPQRSTYSIMSEIVYSPAPESFVSPASVATFISRILNQRLNEIQKNRTKSIT